MVAELSTLDRVLVTCCVVASSVVLKHTDSCSGREMSAGWSRWCRCRSCRGTGDACIATRHHLRRGARPCVVLCCVGVIPRCVAPGSEADVMPALSDRPHQGARPPGAGSSHLLVCVCVVYRAPAARLA